MQKKENRSCFFGAFVLMVLLFLLAVSIPGNTPRLRPVSNPMPASMEMSSTASKAITVEAVVLPMAQNSCLILVQNPVYNLFSSTLKIVADNGMFLQKLSTLEKESDQIKPHLAERWLCTIHFASPPEDPFILS